jgi:phosphohistidine phosphatase
MSDTESETLRIYLVRHASAAWPQPGTRDFDRRLDQRGHEEAARLAEMMTVNGYAPDRIFCSPAVRCVETLEALGKAMPENPPVAYHAPLYSGSSDEYLAVIKAHADGSTRSLMIVGHNPMTEETAAALLDRSGTSLEEVLRADFPTAGLLVVESDVGSPAGGGSRFIGLLTPVDA